MLFALLFQSFHATEHLVEQLSQPHCDHHYNIGKTEIGHAHSNHETCFTCEFTFHGFTPAIPFFLEKPSGNSSYSIVIASAVAAPTAFGGAMFSLRGPPFFTVA